MESGINNNQIKLVWLCHFANQEMKDYFKTPNVNESVPWINLLIELFRERTDVDLHIVAPNIFTNKTCSFKKDNISYFFYKRMPIPSNNKFLTKVHNFLRIDLFTNFYWIKKKIVKYINGINPEIIHLHGAENPYYSAGIIPLIGKFPILLTIQGFIRNASSKTSAIKKGIEIEESIIKKVNHFGVCTQEMREIVLSINPNANFYSHDYPTIIPKYIKSDLSSTFDIVFFARVCRDKGIEDLIQALALIKNEINDISLHIIGPLAKYYKQYLQSMIKSLGIEHNVVWVGFMEKQQDIFKYAVNAKICVLPTYHDIVPGTIVESMLMKLPVIAYNVGGIPELNKNEENIMLVDKLNINQLVEKIILLLKNAQLRKTMAENAYHHAQNRFDNSIVVRDIIKSYKLILNE